MAPIRTQRGFVRRSSRQIRMTSYNEDDLELLYPSDSDSDDTSVGSPSSPIFPAFPSFASFALVINDDVRRVISYSPAAMKYCPEITPACPYAKTTSHSAKRDPDYAPRPPNGFMIFRSNLCANGKSKERKHNVLSQEAGILWARLSEHEKAPFESAAQVVKERHAALYPKYQFKPSTAKKEKKTRSGSKAKKGSKKTRSEKPRITVAVSPSPSPSFDAPSPQLTFPAPMLAMPSSSQSVAFDFASPQTFSPEAEFTTPEFSFTATSQISPMMLPESLIDIDGLAQTLADVCKVEPHDMAADESGLLAVSYYPEGLPLAMYDVPVDVAEYITAFPPLHEATAYSPESTPPPYDTSAPGWSLDSMLPSMEIVSLESSADALFDQYINNDFQ